MRMEFSGCCWPRLFRQRKPLPVPFSCLRVIETPNMSSILSRISSLLGVDLSRFGVLAPHRKRPHRDVHVLSDSFAAAYEEMTALLPKCEFVSFDLEMTGISFPPGSVPASERESSGDSPSGRYSKNRRVAAEFNIIQFGVCLFFKKSEKDYTAMPWNFFVFPGAASTATVRLDASTVEFHRRNGMDFQKWLVGGIPYLNREQSDRLYSSLVTPGGSAPATAQQEQPEASDSVAENGRRRTNGVGATAEGLSGPLATVAPIQVLNDRDQRAIDNVLRLVESWLASNTDGGSSKDSSSKEGASGSSTTGDRRPLVTPKLTPFQRKAVRSLLAAKYDGTAHFLDVRTVESPSSSSSSLGAAVSGSTSKSNGSSNGQRFQKELIVGVLRSKEELDAVQAQQQQIRLDQYHQKIGFRRLWLSLCRSGKPLVCHNGIYDLLFSLHHLEQPLPPSWGEFKALVQSTMLQYGTCIYDTKFIVEKCKANSLLSSVFPSDSSGNANGSNSSTVLKDIYSQLLGAGASSLTVSLGPAATSLSVQEHDAAYDAYMTGVAFAHLCRLLPSSSLAVQFANRLPLYKSVFSAHLNPTEPDGFAWDRDLLFHVTISMQSLLPPQQQQQQQSMGSGVDPKALLLQAVSPAVDGMRVAVQLYWVDYGKTAWLALQNAKTAAVARSVDGASLVRQATVAQLKTLSWVTRVASIAAVEDYERLLASS